MTRFVRFAVEHYLFLPIGAVAALVWANASAATYFRFAVATSFLVNDIGMAFVFGYLAQEVVEAALPGGTLRPWRRALLPLVAAGGGTVGAIAVYAGLIRSTDEQVLAQGWPIACAVDVAFCYVIAKSIFRRGAAVTFLLLLTIAADVLGLIVVSERYPVAAVHPAAAMLVVLAMAGAAILRHRGTRNVWPYVLVCGPLSWFGCYWSGVHPALALLPIVPFMAHAPHDLEPLAPSDSLTDSAERPHRSRAHFEYVFRYPVQAIVFLFGLVNAGVLMRGYGTGTLAVVAAALVGRPLGIVLAVAVAVAAGLQLPHRYGWRDIVILALAASPSFTFGLFFSTAIFPVGPLLSETKIGAMATVIGVLLTIGAARLLRVGRFATP